MHPRRAAALVPLFLALAGCAGDELARTVPAEKVTVSSGEAAEAARLISAYRTSQGLSPVVADAALNEPASAQARAVAEAGRLSHGDFAGRMTAYRVGGWSAENLSAGSATVAGAVARWKGSSGHNANLLMRNATRIGLARADSPGHGYGTYWALVLAQ